MTKEELKVWTKNIIFIILASFISAVALNVFIIPHKFLSGGVGGIALTVQYLSGFNAGYFILIANIPLFFLSVKYIDMRFTFLTVIGTVFQATFLVVTKNFSQIFMLHDLLLSCIYGGILHGAAFGFIFSNRGSLGGSDIISMIIRRKYDLDIGKISFGINLVIVMIGAIFFGLEAALYTLIFMYMVSFVADKVIKGLDRKKLLLIITEKEKEVTEMIHLELKRSCTLLYGEGTYRKEKRNVIYCVVSLGQLPRTKHLVEAIDSYAFISILDTSEVRGKGFKSPI